MTATPSKLHRIICLIFISISLVTHAEEVTVGPGSIVCTPMNGKNPDDMLGPIVMGNMPIMQAIDLLQDFSGRVIIPGEGIPSTKLNFNTNGKLKRNEAIFALENILALNGITLNLLDNGFVRANSTKNVHRNAAPMIETIPEDSSSQQIYTKIFKLAYIDSPTAFNRVRGLLTSGNQAAIEDQPEINSLIVTDTLNNLKRIKEVIELLDQAPEVRLELYTFPVKYGSAWNIRGLYYQLYKSSLSQRLRSSLVYADTRSNKLLVVTHPSNYEFFDNLVNELDKEVAPFTTTEVIKIKQGNYWSIWSTLHGIVRHQQAQFRARDFRSGEERDQEDGAVNRMTGSGETNSVVENAAEVTEQSAPAIINATPGADPNAVMSDDTNPELQFSPYIALYSDPSNLAYVVYGTQSDIKRIRNLVEQLDIKSAPYVGSQVFDVEFARATDIRNVLEYTINVQRRNFNRAGILSGTEREQSAPESGVDATSQGFEYSNFVATIADNRNNTILVQGTQQDIRQVADLIEKLDVESAPLTSNSVIYLKHAQAQTLARVIQNIINYQRYTFARNRDVSQAGAGQSDNPLSPEVGFEFSNYAIVNADRRTNALFVYGTQNDIERVRSIVQETDIPVEPMTTTQVFPLTHTDASQTASLINRVVNGQQRSLRSVRSESREVANPASQTTTVALGPDASSGVVEGDEALQFSSFINITPDRRSNSLIVYGTNSDIQQVGGLIAQVDIEVAPLTTSKVFLLENTQARSLYAVLNSVVRGQERALRQVRSSIREIRNVREGDENLTEAEMTLESLQFSPYVTITPNDRNNSIIIYGTESDIAQLESLIDVSDVKIAPKTQSRTYFIRHADANEVATTIASLISQQQRVRERERTLTRVFRRNSEDGNQLDDTMNIEGDSAGYSDLVSESSSNTSYNDLFSFDEDLQFSPYVSIVADDRSNSVLAYGTAFDLEQVSELIDQIDDVLPQVRIEVVIAEVILTNGQVSGLDSFGVNYNLTNTSQTNISATGPNLNSSNNDSFGLGLSLNDFSLDTVFRVAKEDKFVKVLSAPSITTTHNKQAVLNVGEARPIITSSSSNLNTNNLVSRSTVEYRDIGITLKVRPLVSTSGYIQMDIEQVVETVIDTQLIDNNEQPIIGTRRASSFLSVRDEEVIVLGGLQQVDTSDGEGSVFVLGDLPIFGPLFRPKSKNQVVRELLVFIRPHVVESFSESELLTTEELERTAIGEDIKGFLDTGRFKEQEELHKQKTESEAKSQESETPDQNVKSSHPSNRAPKMKDSSNDPNSGALNPTETTTAHTPDA